MTDEKRTEINKAIAYGLRTKQAALNAPEMFELTLQALTDIDKQQAYTVRQVVTQ